MSYYLYQTETDFKTDLFKLFIESLVFSHALYYLLVWGPSLSDASVNCLKRLQHQAIRLCMDLHMYPIIFVL